MFGGGVLHQGGQLVVVRARQNVSRCAGDDRRPLHLGRVGSLERVLLRPDIRVGPRVEQHGVNAETGFGDVFVTARPQKSSM